MLLGEEDIGEILSSSEVEVGTATSADESEDGCEVVRGWGSEGRGPEWRGGVGRSLLGGVGSVGTSGVSAERRVSSYTDVPLTQLSRLANTGVNGLAFVALGMMLGTLGPSLYLQRKSMQTTYGGIGALIPARSVGAVLGTMLGGGVLQMLTSQANKAITLSSTVIALALVLITYADSISALVVLFALRGVAVSLVDTCGVGLVTFLYENGARPFLHGMNFFVGVGAMLAPLIMAQREETEQSGSYLVLALLILPVGVLALLLRSPQEFPGSRTLISGRLPRHHILWTMIPAAVVGCVVHGRLGDLRVWAWPGERATLLLVTVLVSCAAGIELGIGAWLFSFFMDHVTGVSFAFAAQVTSVYWAMLTAGKVLALPLIDHVRPSVVIAASCVGTGMALLMVLFGSHAETSGVLWTGVVLAGICASVLTPVSLSLCHVFALTVDNRLVTILFVGVTAGETIVPYLMGWLHGLGSGGLHSVLVLALLLVVGVNALLFSVYTPQMRLPTSGWGAVHRRVYRTGVAEDVGIRLVDLPPSSSSFPHTQIELLQQE